RRWKNRTVDDVQVRIAKYPPEVIDDTGLGCCAHPASAQWMQGHEVSEQAPAGVWQQMTTGRCGHPLVQCQDQFDDGSRLLRPPAKIQGSRLLTESPPE